MRKSGYIKLYRSMTDWEWYTDSNTKAVFLHCIFKANLSPKRFEGRLIDRGEFITSVSKLSAETGMSARQVRTALDHLKKTNEVTSTSTSKFTIIRVNNYDKFQKATSTLTNERQASDKQVTSKRQQYKNIENIKNNKEEGEEARSLGEYRNVILSDDEIERLKAEFGESTVESKIERLSEYMETSGKQYNNHFAMLRRFCREDKSKDAEKEIREEPAYDLSAYEEYALRHTPVN